jgi:hypothetical protein
VLAEAADTTGGVDFRAEDSPGADGRSMALGRELVTQIRPGSMAVGSLCLGMATKKSRRCVDGYAEKVEGEKVSGASSTRAQLSAWWLRREVVRPD